MQIQKLIVAGGYVANLRGDVFCSKKRARRGVALEDPESGGLKNVCGSYARTCARYSPLARVSGRNAEDNLLGMINADTLGAGFFSELFTHVGQWGTHLDPPAHFIKGLRTVDQINLKEMILPLVIIDVHEETAKNPDYVLSLDRVKKWEKDLDLLRIKEALVFWSSEVSLNFGVGTAGRQFWYLPEIHYIRRKS